MKILLSLIVSAFALSVLPAIASEEPEWRSWPTGDRLKVGVGLFRPKLNTVVNVSDSAENVGTTLSFEQDLGLSDTKSTPLAFVEWRFFRRHSLGFEYFDLSRSGGSTSGVTIHFGDDAFKADLPIQSFFDIEAYEINYRYSVLFDEKKDLFFGVGLALQKLHFGLEGTAADGPEVIVSEEEAISAPLPTLRAGFVYAFSDKWLLDLNLAYLAVSLDLDDDEKFDGNIWSASAGIRWKAFEHVSFFASYLNFEVDVDYEKRDLVSKLDYDYRGPRLGVVFNF